MKKILICFIGILTFISLMVNVNAVGQTPVTVNNSDGTYTTYGVDSTFANKQVSIIVYKGIEPSSENIEYINQISADENGAYNFSNYMPKEDVNELTGSFKVLVGAEPIESPLSAGTIEPKNVSQKPFVISTDGKLIRSGGIQATVNVAPTQGVSTHPGNEVVVFQLMNGNTPVSIVATERDIVSQEEVTAYFNVDGTNQSYSVRVFVLDSFTSASNTVPISLAEKRTLN